MQLQLGQPCRGIALLDSLLLQLLLLPLLLLLLQLLSLLLLLLLLLLLAPSIKALLEQLPGSRTTGCSLCSRRASWLVEACSSVSPTLSPCMQHGWLLPLLLLHSVRWAGRTKAQLAWSKGRSRCWHTEAGSPCTCAGNLLLVCPVHRRGSTCEMLACPYTTALQAPCGGECWSWSSTWRQQEGEQATYAGLLMPG